MVTAKTESNFYVRFWGVRGSIPCAGPEIQKYGGNTSCLEVRCGKRLLIFDGGSGIRYLGNELMKSNPIEADIFLTHGHMDHVCGFPFFKPFYCAASRFHMHSATLSCCGRTTKNALEDLMKTPLLPIDVEIFEAKVDFRDFNCGATTDLGDGIKVATTELNHPNGATGYRIEFGGKSICYITDTEHDPEQMDKNILGLIKDADIFIYDSMYTDEEYPDFVGFGHSTWQEGVRLADAAGVKKFVAFHHDPDHDDAFMDNVASALEAKRPGSVVAHQGMILRP